MKCGFCGFENPPDFKFCGNCGSTIKILCPSCGFEVLPGFKFCGNCGTKLVEREAEREERAEKRPISILFSDISGFTGLSERLDAEELRTLVTKVLNELSDIVKRNGGYVDKFIGDEIMALFGAPVAYGDDVKRAVKSAIEMMKHIKKNYKDISIHCGIATGDVVVGSVSQRPQDYTAMGDAVNISKRLAEMSGAGQIFVDENTFFMTRFDFEFRPIDLKLKGKTKQIGTYALVSEKGRKMFIGREKEKEEVIRILKKGHPQFISIVGEEGVGISYFIEFIAESIDNSFFVSASPSESFSIIKDLVEKVYNLSKVNLTDSNIYSLSERVGVSPHFLAYIFSKSLPNSPLKYMSPSEIQREIFSTVKKILNNLGKTIVIDNFGDLDIMLKEFFAEIPEEENLNFSVLCGVYKGDKIRKTELKKWNFVELKDFTLEETKAFLSTVLEAEVDDALVKFLWEVTYGNPLFLTELIEVMKEEGNIIKEGDMIKKEFTFPKTLSIRQIILAKNDKIPNEAKSVLQVISCMDNPNIKILEDFFQSDISLYLEILQNSRMIEIHDKILKFKQKIIKETVYDTLLRNRRNEIHKKIYEIAKERKEDLEYQKIAAEQAEKIELYDQAFEIYYDLALNDLKSYNVPNAVCFFDMAYKIRRMLKETPKSKIFKMLIDFGKTLYRIGEVDKAEGVFSESLNYAEDILDISTARRLSADCIQIKGKFEEAENSYINILDKLSDEIEEHRVEKSKIYALLCHLNVERGTPEKGINFGERALRLSENQKNKHPDIFSDAVNSLGRAYFSIGELDKAKFYFDEFFSTSQQINDKRAIGLALTNCASVLYALEEFDTVLDYSKRHYEIAKEIHDLRGQAIALTNISSVLLETGDFTNSLSNIIEAVDIFEKIKDHYGVVEAMEVYSLSLFMSGKLNEAEIILKKLTNKIENKYKDKIAKINTFLGLIYDQKGIGEKAKKYAEAVHEEYRNEIFYLILISKIEFLKGNKELALKSGEEAYHKSKRKFEKIISILNLSSIEGGKYKKESEKISINQNFFLSPICKTPSQ